MTETAHTPLPCPFCSGDAIIIHEDRVWIECADCPSKAEVGPFDTEAEALTAWNTRAVNSHHDLIEALRECGQAIEVLFETADDRVTGVSCIALDMLKDAAKNARAILTKAEAGQ